MFCHVFLARSIILFSGHQVTIVDALYYACEGMNTGEILETKNVTDDSDANQDTSDINSSQEDSTKETVDDSIKHKVGTILDFLICLKYVVFLFYLNINHKYLDQI